MAYWRDGWKHAFRELCSGFCSVFFFPYFLCSCWTSVSLDFVSFPCSFLREDEATAISEHLSERLQVRGLSAVRKLQRGSSWSLCLYNTVHLPCLGRKYIPMDRTTVHGSRAVCGKGRSVSIAEGSRVSVSVSPRCCQQKGKVWGCCLWGVCTAVEYRDVFSREEKHEPNFIPSYCSSRPSQGNFPVGFVNGYETIAASK